MQHNAACSFSGSFATAFRSKLLVSIRSSRLNGEAVPRQSGTWRAQADPKKELRRPPRAVPLKHLMNRYLNEPRAETSLALKLPQVQERFQQRLLNHIFGVRAISHFGVHHSLRRRQVRF